MKMWIVAIVFVLFAFGCEIVEEETDITQEPAEETEFEGITEEGCEAAGGKWNECGSPCAGTDAEVCVQMCSAQCECGGIAWFTCPEGYKCRLSGKVADEIGVCVNT